MYLIHNSNPTESHKKNAKIKKTKEVQYVINAGPILCLYTSRIAAGQLHRRGLAWVGKGLVCDRSQVRFRREPSALFFLVWETCTQHLNIKVQERNHEQLLTWEFLFSSPYKFILVILLQLIQYKLKSLLGDLHLRIFNTNTVWWTKPNNLYNKQNFWFHLT